MAKSKDTPADPMNKTCALCGSAETLPDAKDPVVMTVYSSDLKKYMCSNCYDSMKELEDYVDQKPTVILSSLLGDSEDD